MTGATEQGCCHRWALNISEWQPSDQEFGYLCELLPKEEQEAVKKFVHPADRKRTLISRLMQRQCASISLGIPHSEVVIKRTKGRKPFVATECDRSHAPNFNFNVSHEGDYVVLASEPLVICGVDVAAPGQVRRQGKEQSIKDLQRVFQSSFTHREWCCILTAGSESEQRQVFQRHWSLKEAFVKARGDGIAFELNRAQFNFPDGCWSPTAKVCVDGVVDPRWMFFLEKLPGDHWVSVARGPVSDVVDAFGEFTSTLKNQDMTETDVQDAIAAATPGFTHIHVQDLIPSGKLKDTYTSAYAS